MSENEPTIEPNSKTRVGDIEITCYGREMIMFDHPQLPAPKPVGPKDADEFWSKDDGNRLKSVLNYVDDSIDWKESGPDVLLWLGQDLSEARDQIPI